MLLTSPPIITIPVALLEDNEAILRITAKVISSSFNISSLRRRVIVVSPSSWSDKDLYKLINVKTYLSTEMCQFGNFEVLCGAQYLIYRNNSVAVDNTRLLAFDCHYFCSEILGTIEQISTLIGCINFTTKAKICQF